MALGEHLRADENVEGSAGESAERFLILAFGARAVAVEAGDARAGKFLAQAFFEVLGTFAEKINVFGLALGAKLGDWLNRAAVVAFEAVALLVMGHGNAAIDALHRSSATAAQHGPGIAAAVDEHESLCFVVEAHLNAGVELRRDGAGLMRLLKFFAQVDNFDAGERAV